MPLKNKEKYNSYMRQYRSKTCTNMPTVDRAKSFSKEQLQGKFENYLDTIFGRECKACERQMAHIVDNHYLCLECEST